VFHTMALSWVISHFTAPPGASREVFIVFGLLRPAIGVSLALGTAWLSYNLFEKYMLQLKDLIAPTGVTHST